VKIKLDENLPHDLKSLLRSFGHDVTDVPEEGLSGAADPPVLQIAATEGRILMSFDTDFANIRHYPLGSHNGIVVFRLTDQRWKALEGPVRKLLTSVNLEDLAGGLAIVQEVRIRYRRVR
jgi:predicted nuclease of predicted toxin-antitoxin system